MARTQSMLNKAKTYKRKGSNVDGMVSKGDDGLNEAGNTVGIGNNDENDNGNENKTGNENGNENEGCGEDGSEIGLNAVVSGNVGTHLQSQIESQLQDQLNNDLNETLESEVVANEQPAIVSDNENILEDGTNIDDELKNLERIALNHIAKTAVSFGAVNQEDSTGINVENGHQSTQNNSDNTTRKQSGSQTIELFTPSVIEGNDHTNGVNATDIPTASTNKHSDTEKYHAHSKANLSDDVLKGKLFYMPIDVAQNVKIKNMIHSLGGEVTETPEIATIVLIPTKNDFSKFNDEKDKYLYSYIKDLFKKKDVTNIEKYKVGNSKKIVSSGNLTSAANKSLTEPADISINFDGDSEYYQNFMNKKTNGDNEDNLLKTDNGEILIKINSKEKKKPAKFTIEEDDFILDLVRRNPHLRSTHTFFARIAELPILSNHTGNSIRYRYRKTLSKKLEYVFKIDPETGKPLIDSETKLPERFYDIPSLIKSQYLAEEDYALCKHIVAYKMGEMVLNGKKKIEISQIPEAVFQQLYLVNPRHSVMSWRDRYRKFAAKYGLKKYIQYYDHCIEKELIPEPMKNMSSRSDRKDFKVDVFGSEEVLKSAKRLKDDENYENKEGEDLNISLEKISGGEKLKSNKRQRVRNVTDKVLQDDDSNIILNSSSNTNHNALDELAKVTIEQNKVEENVTESNLENDKSEDTNLFAAATEDEIKTYNIDVEDRSNNTNIEIGNLKSTDNEVNNDNTGTIGHEAEFIDVRTEDNGLMDFKQLVEIDPEPLKNRDNIDLKSMIGNIRDCFRSFGDASTPYELFKDVSDQTGISMLWLNYWFDCSCGMLGTFIEAIINYLKTGQLIMNDVPGFWTEKDDELLKSDPNNKKLLKLHGEDSVTKRKAVLFRYS